MAEPNYRGGINAAYQGIGETDKAVINKAGDEFIAMCYGMNGYKSMGRDDALKAILERDFTPNQRQKARENFEEAAGLKKTSFGARLRRFLINPFILVVLAIILAWWLPFSPETNVALVFFFIIVTLALAFTEWKEKRHLAFALGFGALVFVGTLGLITGPLAPEPQIVVRDTRTLITDEELSAPDPTPTPTVQPTVQPGG